LLDGVLITGRLWDNLQEPENLRSKQGLLFSKLADDWTKKNLSQYRRTPTLKWKVGAEIIGLRIKW
jgi:hypothetical protein